MTKNKVEPRSIDHISTALVTNKQKDVVSQKDPETFKTSVMLISATKWRGLFCPSLHQYYDQYDHTQNDLNGSILTWSGLNEA